MPDEPVTDGGLLFAQLRMLNEAGNPAEELKKLCETFPEIISRGEFEEAIDSFSNDSLVSVAGLMKSVIAMQLLRNPDVADFYNEIWRFIASNELLHDDEERAAALALLLLDNRLPYCKYDLLTLDEEAFSSAIDSIQPQVFELRRVLRRSFSQKTEEASALLSIIDSVDDDNVARVVLFSALLVEVRDESE